MNFFDQFIQLTQSKSEELTAARARMEAVEDSGLSSEETLGAAASRKFAAAADPTFSAVPASADEILQRVRELYAQAEVIASNKRAAIVQVGVLICFCNRFGVSTFSLPWGPLDRKWWSQHPTPCFSNTLAGAIGAFRDRRDRQGDQIYNYSQAQLPAGELEKKCPRNP